MTSPDAQPTPRTELLDAALLEDAILHAVETHHVEVTVSITRPAVTWTDFADTIAAEYNRLRSEGTPDR